MVKRQKTDVRKMVRSAREKDKSSGGGSYANLNLPPNTTVFKPEVKTRYKLDFLMYPIKDPNHMDRDDNLGIGQPGMLNYRKPYLRHRNIGSNNETVTCPKTVGQNCPICEHRKELLDAGYPSDSKEVQALNMAKWFLYIVIPLEDDKWKEEYHIFNFSNKNFQEQLDEALEEDEQYDMFPDFDEGYTVIVRFGAEPLPGGKTYPKATVVKFEDRVDEEGNPYAYPDEVADEVPNLDDVLEVKSYEELERMLHGTGRGEEEEEDGQSIDTSDSPFKDEEGESEEKKPGKKVVKKATKKPSPQEKTEEQASKQRKPKAAKPKSEDKEPEPDGNEEQTETEQAPAQKKPGRPKKSTTSKTTKKTATKKQSQPKQEKTPLEKAQEEMEVGSQEDPCPGNDQGVTFGKDFNAYDICETCDIWAHCSDQYENG